tara:strand:- start:1062 stop:1625 length:564 start_codon:yes stop_codon:yes gene_type:complete
MAQTKLQNYTVQEKLNKMAVQTYDITATLTGDGTSGDVMFVTTEIPNCVAVNGGSCILQSVNAVLCDNATDASGDAANIVGGFKLAFTSNSQVLGTVSDALGTRAVDGGGAGNIDNWSRDVLNDIQAIVGVTHVVDMGELAVASKQNIGAVLQAASDTTSLYVFGITDSTSDYNSATISLKVGVIQD